MYLTLDELLNLTRLRRSMLALAGSGVVGGAVSERTAVLERPVVVGNLAVDRGRVLEAPSDWRGNGKWYLMAFEQGKMSGHEGSD
jgi:hypothetical protein